MYINVYKCTYIHIDIYWLQFYTYRFVYVLIWSPSFDMISGGPQMKAGSSSSTGFSFPRWMTQGVLLAVSSSAGMSKSDRTELFFF